MTLSDLLNMTVNPLSLISSLKQVHWAPYSESSALLSQHGITHGVFGRSTPEFRLSELQPHHATQVHGSDIVEASEKTKFESNDRPAADATYSLGGAVVAVKTADCLPVLLATTDGHWVAAIHAGWRGFSKGIIPKTLDLAREINPNKEIIAFIGPSISRERFEVGPEVVDALNGVDCRLSVAAIHLATSKGQHDRWHIDLGLAAACQLIEAGISPNAIEVAQSCTQQENTGQNYRWHSYRRDGKACGSNWTWIRSR